ncbi:MAG: hypoxanthine phosphoribosyltransferase [Lentisphaerae bacterium]|nr:hypoxanthine phosphoribosyltransferase [Lentisphaerota bacterium]
MDVLVSAESIRQRVAELGTELTEYYRDQPLTVICLLNGALPFAADLMRAIDLPLWYDSFAVSSYVSTKSTGELKIRSALKLPVKDRHILLVDDILDTGFTLHCIIRDFAQMGALSVKSCVLLNKKVDHKLFAAPDWVGFEIDDEFVVGYGLDHNEKYRNLPYIGNLKQQG